MSFSDLEAGPGGKSSFARSTGASGQYQFILKVLCAEHYRRQRTHHQQSITRYRQDKRQHHYDTKTDRLARYKERYPSVEK